MKNIYKNTYTYNSSGNKNFALLENWDGANWMASDSFTGFYDSFGRDYLYHGSEIKIYYSTITDVAEPINIVLDFSLSQNYPNPFNPSTIIRYEIGDTRFVALKIYNVLGKKVATLVNEVQSVGGYEVVFDATNFPSGTYFLKLKSDDFTGTKKLLLLK